MEEQEEEQEEEEGEEKEYVGTLFCHLRGEIGLLGKGHRIINQPLTHRVSYASLGGAETLTKNLNAVALLF